MLDAGDRACAMEVSSHALELHRADGDPLRRRVFTNLTQDHLDFHATMEDYFAGQAAPVRGRGRAPAVVNVDDPYGRRLAAEFAGAVTFAIDRDADYRARDVRLRPAGSRFVCSRRTGRSSCARRCPGRFNVLNVLGARRGGARAGRRAGDDRARRCAGAGRVPGRFEPVDEGQGFAVLVDYAHTPDSLENVLRAARELARGRAACASSAPAATATAASAR